MRTDVYLFLNAMDTRASRVFNYSLVALIFTSIFIFSYQTLPGLSAATVRQMNWVEWFITIVFTVEYGLRVYSAPKRLEYVFSFYGIVDLLAIVPMYLSMFEGFQTLRVLRLFMLLRLVKVARYSEAMARFGVALRLAREELVIYLVITLVLLYVAGLGIYFFEHRVQPDSFRSVFHSLWWAVTTLTTVGYGDAYPITVGGKLFTFVVLMIGLGLVSVPAGIVSSAFNEAKEDAKRKKMERSINNDH